MANENWIDLLENQTEDVTTSPVRAKILDMGIFAYGEFDGATLKIQVSPDDVMNTELYASPDDAEWFDHPDATFTEKTYINGDFAETWMRAVLSGSGGLTDVTLKLRPRVEAVIKL